MTLENLEKILDAASYHIVALSYDKVVFYEEMTLMIRKFERKGEPAFELRLVLSSAVLLSRQNSLVV